MQDVNDDMDDLFRKAAEHYPLKTDGADWQKVFAGLQDASVPAVEEKEKPKRRALWLFLLLPLVLFGALYYGSHHPSTQQIITVKKITDNNPENNFIKNNEGDSIKNKSSSGSQKPGYKSGKELLLTERTINRSTSAFSSDEIKSNRKDLYKSEVNASSAGNKNTTNLPAQSRLNTVATGLDIVEDRKENTDYTQAGTNNSSEGNDNKKNRPAAQPDTSFNRIDRQDRQASQTLQTSQTVHSDKTSQDKIDSMALQVNVTGQDSAASGNTSHQNKSKLVTAKARRQAGFYAGVLASFDVSTIKLQRINKTGYGFELLLGYRFSKRISVESGINWTKKNYYSTGKYFDKTNTGISPLSKIIYTNGSCAMYEIPAVVKYDFKQQKKSNWFATAGLSSYLMKDESYTYYANHSGDYYTATKKYSSSGNNLFSVASLSIGYQLQLNKHLSLRAEPYIKMPLSGIGIAKMPITSAGISAGFTRSF